MIDDLLQIDGDAELQRLGTAAIDGPWQVPAELVRGLLAAGASRVEVGLSRHRITLEADGRGWPVEAIRWLGRLLGEPSARQAALDALETTPALVWLAGLRPSRLRKAPRTLHR